MPLNPQARVFELNASKESMTHRGTHECRLLLRIISKRGAQSKIQKVGAQSRIRKAESRGAGFFLSVDNESLKGVAPRYLYVMRRSGGLIVWN